MSAYSARILGIFMAFSAGSASAQTADAPSESVLHAVARHAGLAAAPPEMPDFVRQTRPEKVGDWVPVFQTPDEPPSTLKSKDDLKAMDADLDKIDTEHDKLRSAFPPSAKAVADKKAADATRKAAKSPAPSPSAKPN